MCEQSFYGICTVANTLCGVHFQLMAIFEGVVFEVITAVVSVYVLPCGKAHD